LSDFDRGGCAVADLSEQLLDQAVGSINCRADVDVKIRLTCESISPRDLEINRKNHAVSRIDDVLVNGT
jgi:hypothetical protein